MAYLDHIRALNRFDPAGYRSFEIDGDIIGYLDPETEVLLADLAPEVFHQTPTGLTLASHLAAPDARTRAVADILPDLVEAGRLKRIRGEMYPVQKRPGQPLLMEIDRGAVAVFGTIGPGVHMNGYVQKADGLWMWVARRALDKPSYPGALDNLVAGGMGRPYGPWQTLIKEAGEEAGIPETLAHQARAVSVLTYALPLDGGLRRDVCYLYDLELPADFTPISVDGEVGSFELMPIAEVARIVDTSADAFKFNCNLVVIDFLIRHGVLTPDHPDYVALISGLRGW